MLRNYGDEWEDLNIEEETGEEEMEEEEMVNEEETKISRSRS